jgi:translocation and assembly module TamA
MPMTRPVLSTRLSRSPPLVLLALALVLAGCSSLPGALRGEPEPPAVLALEVVAPDALAELLGRHLDLGRVNRLSRGEPLQEGELDRLLAAAPQQARRLLDTEGYFNAQVTVERVDAAAGTSPPAAASGVGSTSDSVPSATSVVAVRVTVQPGPRTRVRQVDITLQGPSTVAAAAGDAHARQAEQALRADWLLPPGTAFRDEDWSRAKAAAVAGLRAQGYVQADWLATQARVDAATQQADLTVAADSGPLFRLGPLRVRGLRVQDAQTVRNIADLNPGAPATEAVLLDIQERLQKSDLFDRATVSLDARATDPAATPVVVRLGERKLQEATVGLGYGANVGVRGTLGHVHRRPFGQPWVARNLFDLSRVQQRWEGELSTQTLPRLYRNLVGGALERVESDTDTVTSARLRVGRAQETPRISRLVFAQIDHSSTSSALGRQRSDAVAAHYHGIWRALDDVVLPTRGHVWSGQIGAGHARSSPGGQSPFVRAYARLDAYRPLGNTWYGQGRIELGQVFVRSGVVVPEALRFRAGGDESVRGYPYRSLTHIVDGVEVGSEVLFTASAEVARPLLDRMPALWGALFVDVGRAASRWQDLRPAVGAGVGLRYRSPVGPVKLDLAWGQELRKLRLHLSVGVAF